MYRTVTFSRCVALWLLTLTSGALAEQGVSARDDASLQALRTYLDGLSTLRAEFRQAVISRDLEHLEDTRGRVTLKKPGRFRWDYLEPFERVISADGERVWLYEADLEQVTIRRLDTGIGATPAALLTGATEVLDHFALTDTRTEGEVRWLRLAPRAPESDFASIDLGFAYDEGDDEADDEIVQIFLTDRLGQQTRIYLSDIERGARIDDAFFRFEVPDGADVIDEGDL